MSTITLPNIRVSSDLTVRVRLKDGGLAIDWSTLNNIKAHVYSDAQRAMAGRCDVSVDGGDPTILVCRYASTKMQYLGVNRIIVQCSYLGETKTYDKSALNFVRWTEDQEGEELTIDDPDIDVEIDVEDVTSSILQNILDACIKATEEAQEVVDVSRGPRGYSAYEIAVQDGFEGTEDEWLESLQGETGPQGPQGEQGETGPAGVTDVEVDVSPSSGTPAGTGSVYDGTLSLHFTGLKGQSAYEVAVENGFEGTEEEWLLSLQGKSAYEIAVELGYEGTEEQWIASLKGEDGEPGTTPHIGQNGNWFIGDVDTGVAAGGQNGVTPHIGQNGNWFIGDVDTGVVGEGHDGQDGVGFDDASTPAVADGTIIITLTNGDTMTLDLNHNHPAYYSKVAETSNPSGGFLPDVVYSLGTLTGTVTFALAAAVTGNVNHYFWMFDTGSTAPTITWPSGLTWATGSAPTVAASKHYEISVLNGIAYYSEV